MPLLLLIPLVVVLAAVSLVAVTALTWSRHRRAVRRLSEAANRSLAARRSAIPQECSVCGLAYARFELGTDDGETAACRGCGSDARQRLLWLYLCNETDLFSGVRSRRVLIAADILCADRLHEQTLLDCVTAVPPAMPASGDFDVVLTLAETAVSLGGLLAPGGWALVLGTLDVEGSAAETDPTLTLAGAVAATGFDVTIDDYGSRLTDASRTRFGLGAEAPLLLCRRRADALPGAIERLTAAHPAEQQRVSGIRDLVHGRIEAVHNGRVSGWVWYPAIPDLRATIRVLIDDREHATAVAALKRTGLADAGIGDGGHGFEIRLPVAAALRGSHQLRVETDGGVVLGGATGFVVSADDTAWDGVEFVIQGSVEGRIETVHDAAVQGWAWRPTAPDTPVWVRVRVGEQIVASGHAESERPPLPGWSAAPGRRGFRFELPAHASGAGPHHVRVEAEGRPFPAAGTFAVTTQHQPNSPFAGTEFRAVNPSLIGQASEIDIQIAAGEAVRPEDSNRTCAPPLARAPANVVRGRLESVRGNVVSGWAFRPAAPKWRVGVRVSVDGRWVASGLADLPRPSLVGAGIGDGRHGFRVLLPPEVLARGIHTVTVDAEGVTLPPAALFARAAPAPDPLPRLFVDAAPSREHPAAVGVVEEIQGGWVTGWAWHPGAPALRVDLRLLVDGVECDATIADLRDVRLEQAGVGDGAYAFRLQLPAGLLSAIPWPDVRVQTANGATLPLRGRDATWVMSVSPGRYR